MSTDSRVHIKVTHADCDFTFTKSGGPGGQNVNKRSTKARCVHRASGATGVSADERSQLENKKTAFMRMARTETFRRWAHLTAARMTGELDRIDAVVEQQMRASNLRLEVKDADGRWIEKPLDSALDVGENAANDARAAVSVQGAADRAHITVDTRKRAHVRGSR